eukprot:COSAG02_NODE_9339_length_2251_cov_1.119888_3_plen_217_part_00
MKKDEKTRTISCPIHASIASSKRGWRQTSSQPVERVCGSPRYLPHTIFTLTSSPNSAEFQCQVDQWPSKRYLELIFLGTSGDPVCRRRGAPASRRLPCPKTGGGRRSSRARPIVRCLCSTDCCVASPSCGTAGAVCVSSYVDRFSVATAASRDPSPAYPSRRYRAAKTNNFYIYFPRYVYELFVWSVACVCDACPAVPRLELKLSILYQCVQYNYL